MAVEEGKCYYVMVHAYHHFLIEVGKVLGPKSVEATKVVKIHSCDRGWDEFFAEGCKNDTNLMHFPPGEVSGWFGIFEWNHPIPTPKIPDKKRKQ